MERSAVNGTPLGVMQGHPDNSISVALVQHSRAHIDSAHVSETVVGAWQAIDSALAPVIGRRGIAALYKRSLHLAARSHPWLLGASSGIENDVIDFFSLKLALSQQGAAQACRAQLSQR